MKLLILNSILYTPNNEVHRVSSIKDTMIYNMCLGFKMNGHEVSLAAAEEYEPTIDRQYDFEVLFFKSVIRRIFKPTVLPLSLNLLHYIKQYHSKYDLVISSEVFSFPSLFSSIVCPSKTIIWHELAQHQSLLFKLPSKFWYNVVCKLFIKNVFVIPRSVNARFFISSYCNKVSLTCVEHGINLNKFHFLAEKEDYYTYVGQLIPRKRVDKIITVFAKFIMISNRNVKLIICGDGPLLGALKLLAKELNIEENVEFAGRLNHDELNHVLMKSKGSLIATRQDNNMVSVPESIACGTPILSNTVPTNAYIISENNLGIIKDNWDESDLKKLDNDNPIYVNNCIRYREKLSTIFVSQQILELWYAHKYHAN